MNPNSEDEADNLLDSFFKGISGNSDKKQNESQKINLGNYVNPIRVGMNGKDLSEDKPWIVGTFIPGQYVNETHPGGHNGVDLKAPKGTPVYAVGEGIVLETGSYPKSGFYVKTSHPEDGIVAFYAHLDAIKTSKGQKVNSQTAIGTVGDTGNAKGRGHHLHLEIKQDGRLIDPLKLFGKSVGSLKKQASNSKNQSIRNYLEKYAKI